MSVSKVIEDLLQQFVEPHMKFGKYWILLLSLIIPYTLFYAFKEFGSISNPLFTPDFFDFSGSEFHSPCGCFFVITNRQRPNEHFIVGIAEFNYLTKSAKDPAKNLRVRIFQEITWTNRSEV